MRRALVASLTLIIIQLVLGFYLYPTMPDKIAIHWGLSGEADGYGSKLLGLFLVPAISLIMFPFMLALPKLDPAGGIREFRGSYDWFVFGFLAFFTYLHELTVLWNLGLRFDMLQMLAPAIRAMFYGIGVLMTRPKLNWFDRSIDRSA